ncbi:MAG: germination protein YpeB [Corallococcus sp.]|nr:germination protein YpeB [Corallococcus sp.]
MISKTKSVKNFWTIFFGVVALVAIASAVVIGVTANGVVSNMRMSVIDDENAYKISQENGYKRSLYLACDSMKNLDANLGKIAVSNDVAHQTEMLTKVVVHANQVNQSLSDLPIAESDKLEACQKFANQTQDYATYLLGNLSRGETLSESERASLRNLDNVATNLYGFLQDYASGDSGMFITNGNGANNVGSLTDGLDDVDDNAFEYEKLIYDGPFSDSVEQKILKFGKRISHKDGGAIVSELFGDNVFVGEIDNKGILYVYETESGKAYLTEDGRVAQYETYAEASGESAVSCDKCIEIAEEFCGKLGYDVKGVWISKTQDFVTYVNCATVIDGVIVYPDLIKVAVDSVSGEVVGMEARSYLLNHRDWQVDFGDVSEDTAAKQISSSLKVTNVAKALIEKNGEHYLCYEFQCEEGNRQYYAYVDSVSGKEVELFKVIANTEGYTVM